MNNMKYWADGPGQWLNNTAGFSHLPLADFLANNVKPGFSLVYVYGKAVKASKTVMGHGAFPLQNSPAAAVRVMLQRLRESDNQYVKGHTVFAFKMPDGRYEYHKV
ncbi:MAG: hypothetical protein EBR82_77565 [Caulobacteraceae bacterium]|nr:hypothetical protein [Caulobacteraceae bacterium]